MVVSPIGSIQPLILDSVNTRIAFGINERYYHGLHNVWCTDVRDIRRTRIRKADRRIFEVALSHLNLDADSAWMIGDSLERDVFRAKALGMKTVWVNRTGAKNEELTVADLVVSDLLQVVNAFRRRHD